MDFAANFTAIDFETASRRADSACQLAAVRVRDGQISREWMWLIRPKPFRFHPRNIEIHGITPKAVQGEMVFGGLWPEISDAISGEVLVAHNAAFDMGVLLACLRAHRQHIPDFEFTCTRAIARQTWPDRQRFGLKPLSDWLGIRFRHHDALEDSIACAKVLLAAGIDREAKSLETLEASLRLSRGIAGAWGYRGPTKRARNSRKMRPPASEPTTVRANVHRQQVLPFLFPDGSQSHDRTQIRESSAPFRVNQLQSTNFPKQTSAPQGQSIDLQRLLIRAEFIRPLMGKQVVISGRLQRLSQNDAETLAMKLGGCCQSKVDETTDVLVLGKLDTIPQPEFAARQTPMQVVTEEEFLGMLVTSPE